MSLLYKPGANGGPAVLTPRGSGAPSIKLGNGQIVNGRLVQHTPEPGETHLNDKYVFPNSVVGQNNFSISHGNDNYTIGNGTSAYEGDPGNFKPRAKGSIGGSGGQFGNLTPSVVGGSGVVPANISGMYPSPALVDYTPAANVPLPFTDPAEFAKKYAEVNAAQILKNRQTAKDTAFEQLNTELQGLEHYAPAASALKRNETSADNVFNQHQRELQVQGALPEVKGDLAGQRDRANAYASGKAPNSVTDRALELGVRSDAADNASAGGFGAESSVSRKTSDLMSADQRIKLSQYGDQLLNSNIQTKSNLYLAPTEYSNAGSEVRVMPEVGGARLSAAALADENALTTISPSTALSSTIQQNEFDTSNKQQTTLFNAGNQFTANQINASTKNQFALGLFNYLAGFAGAAAQGTQNEINTVAAKAQQDAAAQTFADNKSATQNANTVGAVVQGVTAVAGAAAGVLGLFSANNTPPSTPSAGGTVPPISSIPDSTVTAGVTDLTPSNSSTVDGGQSNPNSPVSYIPTAANNYTPNYAGTPAEISSGANDYSSVTSPGGVSYATEMLRGVPGGENLNQTATRALLSAQAPHLETLGIHDTPQNGAVPQLNSQGRPVYVTTGSPEVANNTSTGGSFIDSLHSVLDPTGALTKEDSTTLQKIGAVANDVAFVGQLTGLAERGDQKGFVAALGNRIAPAIISKSGLSDTNKAGLNAAAHAANIFTNWKNMTPAQRSLAVAQVGLQGAKFGGSDLGSKVIPGTDITGSKGLTVGEGLGLLAQGYNVYGMVKNWGQINTFNRIVGGTQTAVGLAQTAQHFGLLGAGTTNAAVVVDGAKLAGEGYASTGAYGVGALTGPSGAAVPKGYSVISSTGESKVVMPTANLSSAGPLQYLPQVAGAASILAGAYTIYQGWGKGRGNWKGPAQGALGGASIAAGLSQFAAVTPAMAGGLIVAGALADSWGTTGKSDQQLARDAVRGVFVKNGLTDEKGNLTLADGTSSSIGGDGSGDSHAWKNPALAGDAGKHDLHAYDNDFTNPLDFFAGLQGTALTRILTGGKGDNIDQIGRQLGNSSLGNVGYGKDLTPENFSKVQANMRLNYAKSGITSKAQAYALANQAYSEGRINDTDLVSMQSAYNMVFDDKAYSTVQKLAQGHARGLLALHQAPGTETAPASSIRDTVMNSRATGIKVLPAARIRRKITGQQLGQQIAA